MHKVTTLAAALLLTFSGSVIVNSAMAAEKCPIDSRQSKAVGESAARKVQKAFEAYQAGKLDDAIATLLEADPRGDFDKAYIARMLGNFYAEKGQMDKAIKYLKSAVDADVLGGVDHAATLKLYSDLLLQEKKYKEAISYYRKWMDFTCKKDAVVYRRMAIAYTEMQQWDNALKTVDEGISVMDKPDKGLYQLKFQSLFNLKKYKQAVGVLETMVPLFPDDQRLWVQLAQLYLLTEDYDRSLATYEIAYAGGFLEKPDNIIRLCQLLAQKGSPYRGALILEKHIKSGLVPKDEKNLSMMAGFFHQAKALKQAATYYDQAASISKDGKLYLKEGRILSLDQQYKASIPVLEKALNAGLDSPGEAQYELMLSYLNLKQYKEAYRYAELAAKDKKTAKSATNYIAYIKEKARIHKISL
ncbi:tetratricopeptide repeat protein [Shewanella yunxiaonensis]|uniref:Tetratricopeptide repeat protein n=1 Tax=Shewanella yunxiaonensis TaxID=2829809 RepID=A0ABX7YQN8_9GAMM|nr:MULTISPECIES: tetratricopeptide repeat protein [Shewanella]MDF0533581.1 tetratricopeptide repeat protein [Shewanella sp. A32]QUN04669.1 tetratricopeptide repeat protein [Shewanella yunxiaonensis]